VRVVSEKSIGTITTMLRGTLFWRYGMNKACSTASQAARSSSSKPLERATVTSRARPSVSTSARTCTIPCARARLAAAGYTTRGMRR